MSGIFSIPDESELLEFFGADPVERSVEEGYWCYEIVDARGVTLRFSFNLLERSVQTALRVADAPLATVVHEGAELMRISQQTLTCQFSYADAHAKLVLRLGDSLNLEWSSLRKS